MLKRKTAYLKPFLNPFEITILKIESQKNEENKRKREKNRAINL